MGSQQGPNKCESDGEDSLDVLKTTSTAAAAVFDVEWQPFPPPNNGASSPSSSSFGNSAQSFQVTVVPKIKKQQPNNPQQVEEDLRLPWNLHEGELQTAAKSNAPKPRRRKSVHHNQKSSSCSQLELHQASGSNELEQQRKHKNKKPLRRRSFSKSQSRSGPDRFGQPGSPSRRQAKEAASPSEQVSAPNNHKSSRPTTRGRVVAAKGQLKEENAAHHHHRSSSKRPKSRPRSRSCSRTRPVPQEEDHHHHHHHHSPLSERERLEKAKSKIQALFTEQRQKEQEIRMEHAKTLRRNSRKLLQALPQTPRQHAPDEDTVTTSPSSVSASSVSSLSPTDEATRRWRVWGWYRKLALPHRDLFKELVTQNYCSPDVSVEDVDLLPWVANGAVVAIPDLMKLLPPSSPQTPMLVHTTTTPHTNKVPPPPPFMSPTTPPDRLPASPSPRSILKKESKWNKGAASSSPMASARKPEENRDIHTDSEETRESQHVLRAPKARPPELAAAEGTFAVPPPTSPPLTPRKTLRTLSSSDILVKASDPASSSAFNSGAFAKARQVFLLMEEKQHHHHHPAPMATAAVRVNKRPVLKREESCASSVGTASTCGESVSGRSKDETYPL